MRLLIAALFSLLLSACYGTAWPTTWPECDDYRPATTYVPIYSPVYVSPPSTFGSMHSFTSREPEPRHVIERRNIVVQQPTPQSLLH